MQGRRLGSNEKEKISLFKRIMRKLDLSQRPSGCAADVDILCDEWHRIEENLEVRENGFPLHTVRRPCLLTTR